jgi:hypothetical protein
MKHRVFFCLLIIGGVLVFVFFSKSTHSERDKHTPTTDISEDFSAPLIYGERLEPDRRMGGTKNSDNRSLSPLVINSDTDMGDVFDSHRQRDISKALSKIFSQSDDRQLLAKQLLSNFPGYPTTRLAFASA